MSQTPDESDKEDDKKEAARKQADRNAVTKGLMNPVTIRILQSVGDASKEKRKELKKARTQNASHDPKENQEMQKNGEKSPNHEPLTGNGHHTDHDNETKSTS